MNLQAVLEDFRKAQIIIGNGIEYLENVVGSGGNVRTTRNTRTVNRGHNVATATPGKRKLSAAARKLISDKMKAKWAARKAAAATGKKLTVVGRKKAA
jgi:hypothetical protein